MSICLCICMYLAFYQMTNDKVLNHGSHFIHLHSKRLLVVVKHVTVWDMNDMRTLWHIVTFYCCNIVWCELFVGLFSIENSNSTFAYAIYLIWSSTRKSENTLHPLCIIGITYIYDIVLVLLQHWDTEIGIYLLDSECANHPCRIFTSCIDLC